MRLLPFLLSALVLASCGTSVPPSGLPTPEAQIASQVSKNNLSREQRIRIGRKIWENESGGKVSGLTAWNKGEEFPSLGIGHFIWYPKKYRGPFEESFPAFIHYAISRGTSPPAIARNRSCPWSTRGDFQRDFHGKDLTVLRQWLASQVELQTDFIIARSRTALGKILAASPASDRSRIEKNYRQVARTTNGLYALIDYVNFKGEGISPSEQYRGHGWGLKSVLQDMRPTSSDSAATKEFARAAKRVLDRRIANSPPARGEKRWRQGWHNRCDTYARPF